MDAAATNFCTKCGQPRASAAVAFCTHCGARLRTVVTAPSESAETPPAVSDRPEAARPARPSGPATYEPQPYEPQPYAPQPYAPQPYEPQPYEPQPYEPQPYEPQPYGAGEDADHPYQGPHRRKTIAIAAAVAAVLVIGGVAAWLAIRPSTHTPSAAASHGPTVAAGAPQPTHVSTPASVSSPVQTPSATPTPGQTAPASSGLVRPAPGVAGEQAEASVQAFLDSYFAAINAHSYRRFGPLLSSQEGARIPRSAFESGDGTTTDSDAVLTSITGTSHDELAASVTFTSHQARADSANDSSCTHWAITLYLRHRGDSYLIYPPPASYRASYGAC
jgi:hypothetical protein